MPANGYSVHVDKLENSFIPVLTPVGSAEISTAEEWISRHHSTVKEHLKTAGALLVRGFDVHTAQDFERIGLAVTPLATRYPGGAPREKLADHVWTASETPGKMPISSHCELSYIPNLRPDYILFCCLGEPDEGGETPIANMHDVWESLPDNLQKKILASDFKVVRQFPESKRRMLDVRRLAGPTTAWPDVLGSSDPKLLQSDAENDGVELNFWKSGAKPPLWALPEGRSKLLGTILSLVPVLMSPLLFLARLFSPWPLVEMQEQLPSVPEEIGNSCVELVSSFPGSREVGGRTAYAGVDVFFSEYGWAVEAFFVATRTRRLIHAYIAIRILIGTIFFTMLRSLGFIGGAPLDLRLQGRALPLLDVISIEKAYWKNFEFLKWQYGDVLILNNELCSHGRMPFEGKRRVLTAFG